MQNQKLHYAELIKEIIILTVAVAIIAAAVFFFLVPSCPTLFRCRCQPSQ